MSKFTKGPWEVDPLAHEYGVYCDDATGSVVAFTGGESFVFVSRSHEEKVANAHLISAATEMLAALKTARYRLKALGLHSQSHEIVEIDYAIAKAKGEI